MDHLWLIFGLLSAFSASLVGIFGKLGLQSADPNAATAVRAVIMAVFLLAVVVAQGNIQQIPAIIADKRGLLYIALSGLAGALSWLFYFWALKFGKVCQVAPIDKLSVVIATVLAVVFLGEKINFLNSIGVGLIAIGALIVAIS
ncbi:EamA family transporter [Sporomusa termitida]|uniref:EamA-like transporter family protein n=1 Tax=Sporomusa termitida TaxID=2377 RepID=A0A517DZA6_9FIRM|nr:EamA family transporter [Sporomusa termitida]QDR82671.1 EamA-like transporter family protein [Sporomusa termitida]